MDVKEKDLFRLIENVQYDIRIALSIVILCLLLNIISFTIFYIYIFYIVL